MPRIETFKKTIQQIKIFYRQLKKNILIKY